MHDAPSLENWARHWLTHVIGPLEGVLVGVVCRAWTGNDLAAIVRADEILSASLAPPSIRAASHEMGEQLLSLGSSWVWSATAVDRFQRSVGRDNGGPKWNHAIAFGLLGAVAGASSLETLMSYLHQTIMGIIGAGVRALPVGHTHGQQILAYLHDDVGRLAIDFDGRDLETAGSGSPFYEVLCDEQTQLYSRLFRS